MKKRSTRRFAAAIVFLVLFLCVTALVLFVDRRPVGPENSVVGLAGINRAVADAVGVNMLWYKITKYIGYAAFLAVGFFGILGLGQWIARRSLKAVNPDLFVTAGLYVVVLGIYAFFEKVIINYRPVILDEGLEASFPSSHTMLGMTVFLAAAVWFSKNIIRPALRRTLVIAFSAAAAVTVIGRMISGVHWLTDIAASVFLGAFLVFLYDGILLKIKERKSR